ncbi:hypothetical protein LguiA_002222 [Lonicera macranthoides]
MWWLLLTSRKLGYNLLSARPETVHGTDGRPCCRVGERPRNVDLVYAWMVARVMRLQLEVHEMNIS